jgi:diadenosine tetraphosphate (Ap4A) HIT family hydrolase
MMSSFIKKTLKKAHGDLVERLCQKAAVASSRNPSPSTHMHNAPPYTGSMSSHSGSGETSEKADIRLSGGAYLADSSRNQYGGEQIYPQHLHPLPSQYGDTAGPHRDTQQRDSRPPVSSSSANSWTGAPGYNNAQGYHQPAPAELQ